MREERERERHERGNKVSESRERGEESRRDRKGGEEKKNQGKSGMGADFCQQEVSVTMVTGQRSDVIASNRCLAWRGYFWGLAVQVCSPPSAIYFRTSGEKKGDYPVNEFVYLEIWSFIQSFTDNKR